MGDSAIWKDERIDESAYRKNVIETFGSKVTTFSKQALFIRKVCSIELIVAILIGFICLYGSYIRLKWHSQRPVTTENIISESYITPAKRYKLKTLSTFSVDGKDYEKLQIGSYVIERETAKIKNAKIKDADYLNTKIYILTIKDTSDFFLKWKANSEVTIVRFSALGEDIFTDEEIEEYREKAASYFTHEHYDAMHMSIADAYLSEIDDMAQKSFGL